MGSLYSVADNTNITIIQLAYINNLDNLAPILRYENPI